MDNQYFSTPERARALERYRAARVGSDSAKFGTVGVVVLDAQGNLTAGTSTGGMTGKRWGRIGDSPLIGSVLMRITAVVRFPPLATVNFSSGGRWRVIFVRGSNTQKVYLQAAATRHSPELRRPAVRRGVAVDPRGNVLWCSTPRACTGQALMVWVRRW